MTVRVASLLRLSTKKQVTRQAKKGELDVPAQRQEIATFLATKPGWTLVSEFIESGVSAYSNAAEDRDILQDALRDAKDRKFDVLLIWKGDRLSRQVDELPTIVKRITSWGVDVWSVADAPGGKQWTASNAMELLLLALEGFRNQSYSEALSINVKTRMRQLAADGQWSGGRVSFGYRLEPVLDRDGSPTVRGGRVVRQLVPDPDKALLVQEVYRRYLAGTGGARIAEWLNDLGVPTMFDKRWTQVQVRTVLSNPIYIGKLVYGRRGDDETITAQGDHEPLIDEAIWTQAQEMRASKRRLPIRQRNSTYPLSGVLRCAACGGRMGGHTNRTRLKSKLWERRYYTCLNYIHSRSCNVKYRNADKAELAFVEQLQLLLEPQEVREIMSQREDEWSNSVEMAKRERKAMEEQLRTVEQALKRLDRAYFEAGTIDDVEYAEKKSAYKEQQHDLEEFVVRPLPQYDGFAVDDFIAAVAKLHAGWMVATEDERKALVLHVVGAYGLGVTIDKIGVVRISLEWNKERQAI